jgi:hypothetical protein
MADKLVRRANFIAGFEAANPSGAPRKAFCVR